MISARKEKNDLENMMSLSELYEEAFGVQTTKDFKTMKDELTNFYEERAAHFFAKERKVNEKGAALELDFLNKTVEAVSLELAMLDAESAANRKALMKIGKKLDLIKSLFE